MKKLILFSVLSFMLFALPASSVMAEDETNCVTTTQYGGATQIVCGAKHETVEAGLADINPVFLASAFFGLAGMSLFRAKKMQKAAISL